MKMVTLESTTPVSTQQVIDRFWETIPPVWNHIRGNIRTIASEQFDITVEQFHILRHIRKGLGSVSELAEVRGISRPAISQAVDILVEQGLISREQDVDDRRFVRLALTAEGNELLNSISRQNHAWMREKMAALGTDDLVIINAALALLKTTFDEPHN
jgi:DNA-binding MarR family transcriptional regulator